MLTPFRLPDISREWKAVVVGKEFYSQAGTAAFFCKNYSRALFVTAPNEISIQEN